MINVITNKKYAQIRFLFERFVTLVLKNIINITIINKEKWITNITPAINEK